VIQARWLYYTWVAPAAMGLLALLTMKRFPWIIASLSLFLIGVGPVLGLVPFAFQRYSTVADRYVYLAMLGPALALAAFLVMGQRRRWKITVTAVVLCILGAKTFAQTLVWHDNATLFANGREVNPHSRPALAGLAGSIASQTVANETLQEMIERLSIARNLAEQAVGQDTDYPDSYVTLGSVLNQLAEVYREVGRKEEADAAIAQAIDADRVAVRMEPDSAEALNKLGGLLAQVGQVGEAERLLRRAIELNPMFGQAHLNLGTLLEREHRMDEAFAQTGLAVRLDGTDPVGRTNYAMLLFRHGEHAAALEQIKIARQLNPNSPRIESVYRKIASSQ
jgi:tetratricopeptide (TPR) repeat protein